MSEFPIQLIVGMLAGILANLGAGFLKDFLARRRDQITLRLRLKQGRAEIDLPTATNIESLERRIGALEQVSPRLAILEAWQTVASTIVERTKALETPETLKSSDILALAKRLPEVDEETIQQLARLRSYRNLIAHASDIPNQDELHQVVADALPLISKLTPSLQTAGAQEMNDDTVRF